MTTRTQQRSTPLWLLPFLAALIAALAAILGFTTASVSAAVGAETRVGAINVAGEVLVEPPHRIAAGQRLGEPAPRPGFVVATGVAAETGGLADDMVVVRGGTSDLPGPGEVFSGAYGQTLEDAAAGVPYGQIRATTVGEIRSGGGTVEIKPELTRSGVLNPQHVDICLGSGSCPFGPLMPNPIPKALRIQ